EGVVGRRDAEGAHLDGALQRAGREVTRRQAVLLDHRRVGMREGSVLVLLAARERRRGAGSKPPARRAVVTRAGYRRVREPVDGVLAERAEDVRLAAARSSRVRGLGGRTRGEADRDREGADVRGNGARRRAVVARRERRPEDRGARAPRLPRRALVRTAVAQLE